jgi:hypothetical protein
MAERSGMEAGSKVGGGREGRMAGWGAVRIPY